MEDAGESSNTRRRGPSADDFVKDPMAAQRKDIRARTLGGPFLVVTIVLAVWILVIQLGELLTALGLIVTVTAIVISLRRGLRGRRASLQAFDDALATLRADQSPECPAPPVDVRLSGAPGQDRVVRWGGVDIARWHPDGTITRLDRDPPTLETPPHATVVAAGAPDVEEITLGDAVFVRWGTTWVDRHGRTWTVPEQRALEHGVTGVDWPGATGTDGLLAYLELTTARWARHRPPQPETPRPSGTPDS